MTKDNNTWDISQARIRKFENEVLKSVLPYARFSETKMFGSPNFSPNSFKAKISSVNIFKDSIYEYKGDGNFIHFTSLFALNSILESGYLRMSEFGNLIDQNELTYGAQVFEGIKDYQKNLQILNNFKENVFSLSACQSSENTMKDPYLWQTYGDKGNGVVIEYSFTNMNLVNYIFGNIQYGKVGLLPLEKIKSLSDKFKTENDDFFPENFLELIIEMESFHKAMKFSEEKEVRLIFKNDISLKYNHNPIFRDINSTRDIKNFLKIFLKGRNPEYTNANMDSVGEDFFCNFFPQIEIKRIIFGFGISVEKKVNFMHYFNDIKTKYNYIYELWQMNDEQEIFKMRQ